MFSKWIYLESVVCCRRKVIVSFCKTDLCMITHVDELMESHRCFECVSIGNKDG